MENICYGVLKHKYTPLCHITLTKWVFPLSPKGIWEMEISKARQMAENNTYKLRMSELHSGSLRDYLWKHLLNGKMAAAAILRDEGKSGLSKNKKPPPFPRKKLRGRVKDLQSGRSQVFKWCAFLTLLNQRATIHLEILYITLQLAISYLSSPKALRELSNNQESSNIQQQPAKRCFNVQKAHQQTCNKGWGSGKDLDLKFRISKILRNPKAEAMPRPSSKPRWNQRKASVYRPLHYSSTELSAQTMSVWHMRPTWRTRWASCLPPEIIIFVSSLVLFLVLF